jgi:DNA-binding transcriptional LysR family regulator
MHFDDLDLNLLRVFDIMMREGSVTRTAERMGRTQSAISHSLGKLRILFRDELFTRDGAVMRATPRAVELLSEISGALSTIRSSIDRHHVFDPSSTRRNFRVGLTDYHAMVFVPGLLREFARRAPLATLNIIPANGSEILNVIHLRQVDCVLTGASIRDDPRVQRIELGQDRLLCAVWSGSMIAKRGLTLDAYLAASHLQISADGVSGGLADIALKDAGLRRNIVATISNYLILPRVLRGTEFITHCGDGILHILDDASDVTVVAPPLEINNVSTSLLLQHHMATDPGIVWLTQVISEIYDESQFTKAEIMKTRAL